MLLQISLNGNEIKLSLKDGRKVIAESSWEGEYSLSEQLLPKIDTMLKKCKVKKTEIKKIIPKISPTSGVTSSRIVQTVAKAWNINQLR